VRRFARLFASLEETTKTNAKVAAMVDYFEHADAADAAWAVWFLSGNRPKRLIPVRRLASWAMELADVAPWMFEECYAAVGDLAETIALLLPAAESSTDMPLHRWIQERLLALSGANEAAQRALVTRAWRELDGIERLVHNKLITGELRVGVSQSLVVRALAQATGTPDRIVAHRLTGTWTPTGEAFERLRAADRADADVSQPYPFFLAHALEGEPESLGDVAAWQVEWKWDGIRAQVIRRGGRVFIWSRGEELVTARFPELADVAVALPNGTVIDGELLAWQDGRPLPFSRLQRRIGRQQLTPKILSEVPVAVVAYDLLELEGADVREQPLTWRRAHLETIVSQSPTPSSATPQPTPPDLFTPEPNASGPNDPRLVVSPVVVVETWDALREVYASARAAGAEGLMLKRRDSTYGVGRRRGAWWKWKVAPYSVDAVMIYAEAGHGRRASLHTDYTFAVWDDGELVPFAKAYSGLTDEEIRKLDAWIRRHTLEKFGPVRAVKPEQVFELGFEGIQPSTRHKSGVAVRFPRMLRWRTDKRASEADTLATLRALIG
jgi:DNA ligase-1